MADDMRRVNRIWEHPLYGEELQKLQEAERDRKFCCHTVEHFLDVARLTYMFVLETGLSVSKDVIYGAALLHDIGRFRQYEQGIPHEKASAELAAVILPECGYSPQETESILEAIVNHRTQKEEVTFSTLLYRADKMSRLCLACPAEPECNWPCEKKNMTFQY